ncbi:hypothetical protein BV898_02112 [Hypsibius exemplaris]|uniref:DUF4218 domain-containing protein n=1 Tax=Hypsibius exemplaris TaxID=2072580 RepID=A0A1W0XA18_HYPEX|nr:hypothetical protein BV898_02112 [Hypsibius exemplaris]
MNLTEVKKTMPQFRTTYVKNRIPCHLYHYSTTIMIKEFHLLYQSQITIMQFVALFLNAADRGRITHQTKNDLLRCVGLLFSDKSKFPRSMYTVKDGLEKRGLLDGFLVHFLCTACGTYIDKDTKTTDNFICPAESCSARFTRCELEPRSFITIPMAPAIQRALESGKLRSSLQTQPVAYDGISKCARDGAAYKRLLETGEDFVDINLFSDSALTSKSSMASVWSVLFSINNADGNCSPRIHTIYNKSIDRQKTWKEPQYWKQGLATPLINELKLLREHGLEVVRNGARCKVKVYVLTYNADCPERWNMLNFSSYMARFGCAHCETPGKRVQLNPGKNRKDLQCYPFDLDNPTNNVIGLRDLARTRALGQLALEKCPPGIGADLTDDDKELLCGVKGTSILSQLGPFEETRQTPPDPMHLLGEGIGKALVGFLVKGPQWKLKRSQLKLVNAYLASIQPTDAIPRLPRELSSYKQWTAGEFIAFIQFYCLPCLHGVVPTSVFLVIAKFCVVVQCLLSPAITEADLLECAVAMHDFSIEFQLAFGERFMTYNIHQYAVHLPDYIVQLGPPRYWWAFPFEAKIGNFRRYQQNTHEQNKELAGKIQLSSASSRLRELLINPQTSETLKKVSRTICFNEPSHTRCAEINGQQTYFCGAAHKLKQFAKPNTDEHRWLVMMIEMRNGAPLEMQSVELFDRVRTAGGIALETLHYTRKESRVNVAFKHRNGKIYLSKKFVLVSGTDRTAALVWAVPMDIREWGYFGFDDQEVLKKNTGGFLVLAQSSYIWKLSLSDGGELSQLQYFIRLRDPMWAVAVDCRYRYLYWSNHASGLTRSLYDGSRVTSVAPRVEEFRVLAVDFVTGNIWSIQASDILVGKLSDLTAEQKTIIMDERISTGSALAVHPVCGFIY